MEDYSEIPSTAENEDISLCSRLGNMGFLPSFLLLLITNAVGFSVGPILYVLTIVKFRMIEISEAGFNPAVEKQYMMMTTMTWFICALFSLSALFLKGQWKLLFGFAPVAVPLIYDLVFLARYM